MPHAHPHGLKITCMKTASYAAMHFVVAIAVAYALTRDWRAALAIGIVEPLIQTIAFFFHDKAWRGVGAADAADVAAVDAHTARCRPAISQEHRALAEV
jgi:uncharacterized membrane protein